MGFKEENIKSQIFIYFFVEDLLQLKIDTETNDLSSNKHVISQDKPIVDFIPDLEYEEEFAALVTTDGNNFKA